MLMQTALYVVIKLTIYQATINMSSCSRFLDAGAGKFLSEAGTSPSGTLDPDSRHVTLSMNESTKEGASDKQSKIGDSGDMPLGKSNERVHFSCMDIRLKGAKKQEQQTRQERNSGNVANETKVSTIDFPIVDQLRSYYLYYQYIMFKVLTTFSMK